MTSRRGIGLVASVLPLVAACSSTRPETPPESAATNYERLRIAGDTAQIQRLLVPSETLLVSQRKVSLQVAGISDWGILFAKLDSSRLLRRQGDTAVVVAYLTAPMGDLLWWMMARTQGETRDTSTSAMRRHLEDVPRGTVEDTVTLVQSGEDWKVVLWLADRAAIDTADTKLFEAWRDDDLKSAIAPANAIIEIARRSPPLVEDTLLRKAREVVQVVPLIPMIATDLDVKPGSPYNRLKGSIRNRSDRDIASLVVVVQDSGERTDIIMVRKLGPGERRGVDERTLLDEGRPKRTEVGWIHLGAWLSNF